VGGVIGIELGKYIYVWERKFLLSIWTASFLVDSSLSKELTKVFKKQGMKFVSHKVKSVERSGDVVTVQAENTKGRNNNFEGDCISFSRASSLPMD
jgi:dihydrolipoamide dehydrogenase